MLTKSRLQLMIKLAEFRQENQDGSMLVVKHYRSDYIALALIKNLFITTLAWLVLIGLFGLYHLDFLLNNLNQLKVGPLMAVLVITYLMMLGIYSVVAYMAARIRYVRSYTSVREYDQQLRLLAKIHDEEEREREEAAW
ncbi:MAG: hypothetical protein IJ860_05275 [Eubacterium sp.]|nr:hypothetical protein [Eubacterium sp.]